jgi:hypothetical protein
MTDLRLTASGALHQRLCVVASPAFLVRTPFGIQSDIFFTVARSVVYKKESLVGGYAVSQSFEALRYKREGHGSESKSYH